MSASPSSAISWMEAVASTWPWTMWPPSRSLSASGRSRFTGSPSFSAPRLVRRSVSGTTSTRKLSPSSAVTVRHAPLTLMLSLTFRSDVTFGPATVSPVGSTRATLPTSSTIPVNIRTPGCQCGAYSTRAGGANAGAGWAC